VTDDDHREFLRALLKPAPESTGLFKRYTERPDSMLPEFMRGDAKTEGAEQ
jgi:hypothetical protein